MLVDRFGHRLSGSPSLEAAIDWILAEMKKDGLQNVRGEPVSVTNWQRGEESAELVKPHRRPLVMLGLGGSVATPSGGITAPVLVVSSFDELEQSAAPRRRARSCCSTRRSRTIRIRAATGRMARPPRHEPGPWPV